MKKLLGGLLLSGMLIFTMNSAFACENCNCGCNCEVKCNCVQGCDCGCQNGEKCKCDCCKDCDCSKDCNCCKNCCKKSILKIFKKKSKCNCK